MPSFDSEQFFSTIEEPSQCSSFTAAYSEKIGITETPRMTHSFCKGELCPISTCYCKKSISISKYNRLERCLKMSEDIDAKEQLVRSMGKIPIDGQKHQSSFGLVQRCLWNPACQVCQLEFERQKRLKRDCQFPGMLM